MKGLGVYCSPYMVYSTRRGGGKSRPVNTVLWAFRPETYLYQARVGGSHATKTQRTQDGGRGNGRPRTHVVVFLVVRSHFHRAKGQRQTTRSPGCLPLSSPDAPMPPPPPSVRGFLDAHFASPDDLAAAPALAELLRRECDGLDASLRRAEARLGAAAASWLARYSEARANLLRVRSRGSLARSLPSTVVNPSCWMGF
jgi:hypothetical protein